MLAAEQGAWAGNTALKILEGTSPKDIPVVSNEKGQFYVNMPLANKLPLVPTDGRRQSRGKWSPERRVFTFRAKLCPFLDDEHAPASDANDFGPLLCAGVWLR